MIDYCAPATETERSETTKITVIIKNQLLIINDCAPATETERAKTTKITVIIKN